MKSLFLTLILMLTTSCGNQPKLPEIPGIIGPLFSVVDGKVLMTLKLLKANLNQSTRVPIPKTKNSSFEVSPTLKRVELWWFLSWTQRT